ncbi:MAG: general secretion pathway protein GspK [Syntrophobacterales bacterium]|jgi:general secretion pathway protein K|nr:general secretion pathway protein GspK [Syntrophobacterales bacterium]
MRPSNPASESLAASEEGVVLLLVLLVLALISVLVLSWSQEWRTELKLAANFRQARQSRRLAEAGLYYGLGKLVAAKAGETMAMLPASASGGLDPKKAGWPPDGNPHVIQLPEGSAEVRLADEGGKINLNRAPEVTLRRLFAVLGFSELKIRTMVESIQDWRTKGDQALPYGAKSAYYLSLDPPYVAKNGLFETVEELSWVRGFEGVPSIYRLGEWLTVQQTGKAVNINTAPRDVLMTLGIPPEAANLIITARQNAPITNLQAIAQWSVNLPDQMTGLGFNMSPFFTIKSTGMVKNGTGRHTIKAIVRINVTAPQPWEILSWADDFPG